MTRPIIIKEVITKKDRRNFLRFPFTLYRHSPYWVPPILKDERRMISKKRNPAFGFSDACYWLAWKEGRVAGRIGGIINHRYNEKVGKVTIRFSMIEFEDDMAVSGALLETVERWARSKGGELIHGPFGFCDMDHSGMLVEGFEETGTMAAIYNHAYYPFHMERHGYRKETDWIEFEMIPPKEIPEKVEWLARNALERYNLKVLKVKRSRELLPYAREIFKVLNVCYENLHGFISLTEEQINMYVKQYFGFILPAFVPLVLNSQGEIIAFGITMPSLTKALQKANGRLFPFGFIHLLKALKKNDQADLYLTGVRPDYQNRGINAVLLYEMNKVFLQRGIRKVESNPELETNAKVTAQWRFYERRQHKRRRCYIKEL